jgi:mannose-1-phosphate guanylyltransferase
MGIAYRKSATGFGYIERNGVIDDAAGVYKVKSFKEKPDFETATKYVESANYLWNCGYFVGSVATFLNEMQRNAPELLATYKSLAAVTDFSSDEYNQCYLSVDNQVIDIALIEKADKLAVVAASFDWMDIGNFKDLHDVVIKDEADNYLKGENIHAIDVDNVYIRNEERQKPVAVIGLDNVIVVNTLNGILVARKDVSAKCGDVAKKLQA